MDSKKSEQSEDAKPPLRGPAEVGKFEMPSLHLNAVEHVVNIALQEVINVVPTGWRTVNSLIQELHVAHSTVRSIAEMYRDSHPEWFQLNAYSDKLGRLSARAEYLSPVLQEIIFSTFAAHDQAPDGWMTNNMVSMKLQRSVATIRRTAELYIQTHPHYFNEYRSETGNIRTYYAPELVEILEKTRALNPIPEGWVKSNDAIRLLNVDRTTVYGLAESYEALHPDWSGQFDIAGSRTTKAFSPLLIEAIQNDLQEHSAPPEGWVTLNTLGDILETDWTTIKKAVEKYEQAYPDYVGMFRKKGHTITTYISPRMVELITQERTQYEERPDGWATKTQLVGLLSRPKQTIGTAAEKYREEHPEWFQWYRLRGTAYEYYSPELINFLELDFSRRKSAPPDWQNNVGIGRAIGKSAELVRKIAESSRADHPGWFDVFENQKRQLIEYYNPELIELIKIKLEEYNEPPEDWVRIGYITALVGKTHATVEKKLETFYASHPEWFGRYTSGQGRLVDFYSPELASAVIGMFEDNAIPEGWLPPYAIARNLSVGIKYVESLTDEMSEDNPDWVRTLISRSREVTYYSPVFVEKIRHRIGISGHQSVERQSAIEQGVLKLELEEFLTDSSENNTYKVQYFQSLIHLFGAGTIIDILYQQHPEYQKLPVPYVKSKLAEFLGDFLSVAGDFSIESLEKGAPYLSSPVFNESLTEVIKNDCLRLLNRLTKTSPDDVNLDAVTKYIDHIREQSIEFTNSDLEKVLTDVEAYYELLFENIHKPNYIVDELEEGRLFPDINQRINVQEIAFKHKILIADEMGTGKSASSIMAKEILGAKQALIVVPSNVVSVWQNYLSDEVSDDGSQTGYFKEGQVPRVLTVNSPEDLDVIDAQAYDYVIVSQERLNERYIDKLAELPYDMLIIDEMHKLKNVSSGKRSENLMKLAKKIDDNEYLVLLSGTPVPNKIGDIALTLKLLYPERFMNVDNSQLVTQILNGDMLDLRSLLVPRMQMKSLSDNIEMPKLNEKDEIVELTEQEKEIYQLLVEEDELTATEKMTILRQFTLNPRLLDATPNLVGSKPAHVGAELRNLFSTKDKAVMFVNSYIEGVMRGDHTMIEDLTLPNDVEILRIDGSVSQERRLEVEERLNSSSGKVLLVVSGQTADTGVDFSSAEAVLHYNEPWSLYDKQQQTARVYRPGLKDDLIVQTFITEGTIERGIHEYIETKYNAVEKLLHGVPISEIEQRMLKQAERDTGQAVEVAPELAKYYFSAQDTMARIYGHVKEIGEPGFIRFLDKYGKNYAESYADLTGSRSYQANVGRLAGTMIKSMIEDKKQDITQIEILDLASGPEMLRRHIADDLADRVTSLDINEKHFEAATGKTIVSGFTQTPLKDKSVDYLNLSLGIHYTSFVPSKGNYERLQTFQEANRILKVGGRMTIGMIYSLELSNDDVFKMAIEKIGMKVVDDYSGQAAHGKHFQTQVITLEKVVDCNESTAELIDQLGAVGIKALKFKKKEISLADSRKMARQFTVGNRVIHTHFNQKDALVRLEEAQLVMDMGSLKSDYKRIESIPKEEIIRRGFARIFNGKRYVLFKRLSTDIGAVAIR